MSAPGPGQTLFTFVRHWSRRHLAGDGIAEQGRLTLVTEAVHALDHRGVPPSINAIAREIGIDQSGASRLVRSATHAGYLTMLVSAADGRQRHAAVTTDGHRMLAHAHDWQEAVFAQLTEGWSESRRRDLQQAMVELIDRSPSAGP